MSFGVGLCPIPTVAKAFRDPYVGCHDAEYFLRFFHGGVALGPPPGSDAPGAQAIPDALWTKGNAVTLTEANIGENLRCLSNERI